MGNPTMGVAGVYVATEHIGVENPRQESGVDSSGSLLKEEPAHHQLVTSKKNKN